MRGLNKGAQSRLEQNTKAAFWGSGDSSLRRIRSALLSGTALTACASSKYLYRPLYGSVAAAVLLVTGGQIGSQPAMAQAIIKTTPTNLGLSQIGTILDNRPRNASGGNIVTNPGDSAGVDVQVLLQLQALGANVGLPFHAVGDIDIEVGDVQALHPGQKGINAINAAGNITIEAGDIESDGRGVNAEVEGHTISIPAIRVILPNGYSRNIPGTGNVSVNVGDVTSIAGDGINATTGFGTVFVKAGDIQAENGFGVNATSGLGFGLPDLSDLDDVDVDALVSSALLSNGVHVEVGDVTSKETGINAQVTGVNLPIIGDIPGAGNIYVSAGNVTSTGGKGVNAATEIGFVTVSAGDVSANSDGVDATTELGIASVFVDDVTAGGVGINAAAGFGAALVFAANIDSYDTGIKATADTGLAFAFANDVTTANANAHGMDVSAGGVAVAISTGTIATIGEGAFGISANAGDGIAGVLAGNVVTTGEGSTGIYGQGSSVYIVAGNVETRGDNSAGIRNDANGTSVTLFGFVNTFGDNSPGVDASDPASDVFVAGLGVTTGGVGSNGINATSGVGNVDVYVGFVGTGGDSSRGIHAFSQSGDVGVTAGFVGTLGANSDGIRAVSLNSDVDVNVLAVGTAGNNSDGIRAFSSSGDVEVNALAVGTSGDDSNGIRAVSLAGNVDINTLVVGTTGSDSDGIRAYSRDGDIRVTAGFVGALGDGSHGIHAITSNGSVDILVKEAALGGGEEDGAGVVFGGGSGANLLNEGFIGALNHRAIVNDDNDSVVENKGIVAGYLVMGQGNDVFKNTTGALFLAYGDSDFGTNAPDNDENDLFENAGRVAMLPWHLPQTATIKGLETFDNSLGGEIWLRNNHAGDVLKLPDSNFVGGGIFAIDAELREGGKADELHIGKDISGGVTALLVNDVDPKAPGAYDPNGITFAVVGGGTQVGDFSLVNGPIDKGLFTYDIFLRDGAGENGENLWVLASTPDQTFFELPSIISAAQSLWYSSTGVWLDRTADLRSASAACTAGGMKDEVVCGPAVRPGVWAKAFGNWSERSQDHRFSLHGRTFDYKVEYDQDSYGIIGGFDFAPNVDAAYGRGGWLLGVMAGYINSTQDFKRSTTNVDMEGALVGAYATYLQDGLFVDAQIAANIGEVRYSSAAPGLAAKDSADLRSIGGIIDVGYRMPFGSASTFIEPGVTLAYVNSNIDNVTIFGTKVDFKDGDSLRGRLGVRLGTSMIAGNHKIEPFVGASAWYEFKGENEITAKSNGYELAAKDDVGGWIGEVSGGINLFDMSNAGVSGFAKGNYQFGDDDYRSFSGQLGIRVQW